MLKLKLRYFGHLMQRTDSMEKTSTLAKIEGKRRSWRQRMRRLDSITDSMDMNLSKLQEIVKNKGAWHVAVLGVSKSHTRLSDRTTTIIVSLPRFVIVCFVCFCLRPSFQFFFFFKYIPLEIQVHCIYLSIDTLFSFVVLYLDNILRMIFKISSFHLSHISKR